MRVFGVNIFVLIGIGLVVLVGGAFVALYIGARLVPKPDNVGNGDLAPCPSSPNCVSSQADPTDSTHYIEPFSYTGTLDEAREQLLSALNNTPGITLMTEQDAYIYVEARTPTMGFVDDLEFVFDDDEKVIHVRSAARMGQGDLGNNRARMEAIRSAFNSAA